MVRELVLAVTVVLVVMMGSTLGGLSVSQRAIATQAEALPSQPESSMEKADETSVFPPGTSAEGIENVSRLTEAHWSALNGTTYEERVEWDQVSGASDRRFTGFELEPIAMRVTSGSNRSLIRIESEDVANVFWVTDDATALKTRFITPPPTPFYQYHNSPDARAFQAAPSELLHEWLNTSTYDYTGTITRDGETLYEFWSAGLRGNTTPIEDAHARVLVDPDGVIHEAIVTRTYRRGNVTVTARLEHELQRTGTAPPSEPKWVTAELPHLDASVVGNGTVVAIEHTGGTPISNATVRTYFPDTPQFDISIEGFEPGETLYLYRTQAAPDRVLVSENEPPAVNESFVPVGEEFVLVSVFDRPASLFGPNESLVIEVEPRNR